MHTPLLPRIGNITDEVQTWKREVGSFGKYWVHGSRTLWSGSDSSPHFFASKVGSATFPTPDDHDCWLFRPPSPTTALCNQDGGERNASLALCSEFSTERCFLGAETRPMP